MLILGLETSCDETAAAVIKNGREILSNIVSSQIKFHRKFGGVFPELASRKHLELINPVIQQALAEGCVTFKEIDLITVTQGPGLIGSLLIGLSTAKAIAYVHNLPLMGINHLEGHIYANFLEHPTLKFPFVSLIVSGGHTVLVYMKEHNKYELLGSTRDDAAGEVYDKVARLLDLGYPGGPFIDKLAQKGNPQKISFPRAHLGNSLDFSFSGLKTAVLYYLQGRRKNLTNFQLSITHLSDIAASFQQAVTDVLVEKSLKAAQKKKVKTIILAGGVAANRTLRRELKIKAKEKGIKVYAPSLSLCTDNAAMIAAAGYYKFNLNSS